LTSHSFARIRFEIVTRLNQNRASTRYQAKFRTGWTSAEQYPDEAELASAIKAVVDAGVPFKATADLHHAVRSIDPETGLEQHGVLNLLYTASGGAYGDGRWGRRLGRRCPSRICCLT
jgi:hypothetical protein